MLDHEGPRIALLWVLSHVGIPGNEKADQAAKAALDQEISTIERYPPDDLKKWLTEEDFKKRDQRWKNGNKAGRRQRVRYERNAKVRASGHIQPQNRVYEGHPRPQDGRSQQFTVPFLQHLSIRRLWECKETEDQRMNMDGIKAVQSR
jgi:hypothetical protein